MGGRNTSKVHWDIVSLISTLNFILAHLTAAYTPLRRELWPHVLAHSWISCHLIGRFGKRTALDLAFVSGQEWGVKGGWPRGLAPRLAGDWLDYWSSALTPKLKITSMIEFEKCNVWMGNGACVTPLMHTSVQRRRQLLHRMMRYIKHVALNKWLIIQWAHTPYCALSPSIQLLNTHSLHTIFCCQ